MHPCSSVELEQAASTRKVGSSNLSRGAIFEGHMENEKPDIKRIEYTRDLITEVIKFYGKYWNEDELINAKEHLLSAEELVTKWIKENK